MSQPDQLIVHPGLPRAWLARVQGKLWIVPAGRYGWDQKSEYLGQNPRLAGFQVVDKKLAAGCGIPWSEEQNNKPESPEAI